MTVYCPVFNKEIDDGSCFDCSMAAEDFGSATTAKAMNEANSNYDKICLSCKYHPEMKYDGE